MGEIKLFRYGEDGARELAPHFMILEKDLQITIEKHMELYLGVRLLARQYRTGRPQAGFIDSLGLDENHSPVIIEYKRYNNENIISQGLFYLDWLMTHKAEFREVVKKRLGDGEAANIEFDSARVICMASAFSRYDEHAIMQIDRNVELIRYRFFENDLLMLEMLNTSLRLFLGEAASESAEAMDKVGMPASLQERIRSMSPATEELYLELLAFTENLGDDVNVRFLKHYIALSRFKNFTCIQPLKNSLKLWLNLDPASIPLEDGFSRDVSAVGHHASGNVEIEVRDEPSFQKAQPYIEMAYSRN